MKSIKALSIKYLEGFVQEGYLATIQFIFNPVKFLS